MTGCSSSVPFTPGFHRRTNNYLFSSGRQGEISSARPKFVHAFGKLSLSRVGSDVVRDLTRHASLRRWLSARLQWVWHELISSCKGANEVEHQERGWRQMQVKRTAKADIVLVERRACDTFRAGLFHDRYPDSGIRAGHQLHLSNGCVRCPRPSRAIPGPTRNAERAASADHDLRHDEADVYQRRL